MKHGGKRTGSGRPKGVNQYGESTKPIRLPLSLINPVLEFVKNKGYQLPLYSSKISAGMLAVVEDHVEAQIDLHRYLVKNPANTFLLRVTGTSMINTGIYENDILIVDRTLHPIHGKIVIAAVDGNLTVKRLHIKNHRLFLMPENETYKPIEVKNENEIFILGVVTKVIHDV